MNDITLMDGTSIPAVDVQLPDGSKAKEFLLPSGSAVIRARSVPPMLAPEILDEMPELADPPLPMVEVKGGQGIPDKMLPARPGEAEYEAYVQERQRREKLRDALQSDLFWDYGVVSWRGPDEEEWVSDPPKTWKFPAFLRDYGKEPRKGKRGRRIDFIKYALITHARDMEAVQMVMYGMSKPLSREEVDAAADMFQGDENGSAAS